MLVAIAIPSAVTKPRQGFHSRLRNAIRVDRPKNWWIPAHSNNEGVNFGGWLGRIACAGGSRIACHSAPLTPISVDPKLSTTVPYPDCRVICLQHECRKSKEFAIELHNVRSE